MLLPVLGITPMFGCAPLIENLVILLFYRREILTPALSVAYLMLPLILIEASAGGYLGYQIYQYVKKVQN